MSSTPTTSTRPRPPTPAGDEVPARLGRRRWRRAASSDARRRRRARWPCRSRRRRVPPAEPDLPESAAAGRPPPARRPARRAASASPAGAAVLRRLRLLLLRRRPGAPAAPAAGAAAAAAPPARLQGRYELRELAQRPRSACERFRGARPRRRRRPAPVVDRPPAAAAGPEPAPEPRRAGGATSDEILPSFDEPAAGGFPATEVLPGQPAWPSIAWERRLLRAAGAARPAGRARPLHRRRRTSTSSRRCRPGRPLWDAWDDPDAGAGDAVRLPGAGRRGCCTGCTSAAPCSRGCGPTSSSSTTTGRSG